MPVPTIPRRLLRMVVRGAVKPFFNQRVPISLQRAWMRAATASSRPPRGTETTRLVMGTASALRLRSTTVSGRPGAMLYLHGGGYCLGSASTHIGLTGYLARESRQPVYSLNYRLAPEHAYPAAVDDAVAAYRWLLEQGGYQSTQLSVAGDSAGGGLALALALRLRAAGLPLPAALVLISPWTDLTLSGSTLVSKAGQDPLLSSTIGGLWSRHYLQGSDAAAPECSPLFAELTGLPPMCIHVGSDEILLSDSTRFVDAVRQAGGQIECHEWDGLWHDFPLHAGLLREANQAITEMAAFVAREQ